jgi:3-oxoacyl-[acyl-carrier-protein] synthase II
MSESVFISGMGMITPLGPDVESTWAAGMAGKTAYGPLVGIDVSTLPVKIGGWIPEDMVKPGGIPGNKLRGMGKYVKVGITAAQQAVAASGLDWASLDPQRVGAFIATGTHGNNAEGLFPAFHLSRSPQNTLDLARLGTEGVDAIHPWWLLSTISNNLIFFVTHVLGIIGPNSNYCNSSLAGVCALDCALDAFQREDIDVALVGGADCPINWQILSDFSQMEFLATGSEAEVAPLRPFSPDAPGTILTDAGAFLVLERASHLERRHGTPLAQLEACRMTMDSSHSYLPDPTGAAVREVLAPLLLAAAGAGELIVHPAGIGHPKWDQAEIQGLQGAFDAVARRCPVVPLKPILGHAFSVSAILETAWGARSLRAGPKNAAAVILSRCFGGVAGGILLRDV